MIPFLPIARVEADDAADWYEKQRSGLGMEFIEELKTGLGRIEAYPETFPIVLPGFRRCLLRRFPYGIIFRCVGPPVIIAVMHLHPNPDYWKRRI